MTSMMVKQIRNLKGTIKCSGSKNAGIPILCASLLYQGKVKLKNVSNILDINNLLNIFRYLNCKVKRRENTVIIDSKKMRYRSLCINDCTKIRGSYYLIPVFLYLYGKCEIALPGGCKIGARPIDTHLAMLEALGCEIKQEENRLLVTIAEVKKEFKYWVEKQSVGASINTILASLMCDYAVIDNLTIEPEGKDLIDFLTVMGFDLSYFNSKCVYKGHVNVKKVEYKIIPDRMEAMTFIILGLLCGNIKVKNVNVSHLSYPLKLLVQAKYKIIINKKYIRTLKSRGRAFNIKTDVYPFFPTDMQPLFGVLLAYSAGDCVIEENIFENRMNIYYDLINAKANINVIDNKAYIIGTDRLSHGEFECVDLRQGAAIIIHILKSGGSCSNIDVVRRGYEDFFYKLLTLGANFSIK